jgi:hypothetical protein
VTRRPADERMKPTVPREARVYTAGDVPRRRSENRRESTSRLGRGQGGANGRRAFLAWSLLIATCALQVLVTWMMWMALVAARDPAEGQGTRGAWSGVLTSISLVAWLSLTVSRTARPRVRVGLGLLAIASDLAASWVAQQVLARWSGGDDGAGLAWGFASTFGLWAVCALGAMGLLADASRGRSKVAP